MWCGFQPYSKAWVQELSRRMVRFNQGWGFSPRNLTKGEKVKKLKVWQGSNYNTGSGDLSHMRRKVRSWGRNKRQWKSHRVAGSESFCEVVGFKVPVVYTKIWKGGDQRTVCLSSRWWGGATIMTMPMGNWLWMENKNIWWWQDCQINTEITTTQVKCTEIKTGGKILK